MNRRNPVISKPHIYINYGAWWVFWEKENELLPIRYNDKHPLRVTVTKEDVE
jgi:hypothetical protein